ncbi:MAG TPA: zinc-dependent alcohol dehydrogenase family protein [Phycisphaerae bacterium]|nr:zinc-dependent alcohol dehydrogenase family protein [Phycisphaerae bacterium]
MKAMVLEEYGPAESGPLKRRELPDPRPGPGEARVAVKACGVCRTDLHVIEKDLPPAKRPVIPGHQAVGVVDALGEGCTRLKLGQRVGIAWLRHTCGQCRFCGRGRENLCESQRFTGYHADGGYATAAVVPEAFAYEIPDAFGDVEAAPLLCAGIIGYRALKRSQLPDGGRLALYGFGSSAHVVIQLALHRGCQVYVVTRGESHRQLARRMGAAWVGERAEDMPVRVDSAILFAPVGELVPPALEKLEKGGTLALAGIYMTPIPQMDYERYVFYERNIHSVTANTRADGRELLAEAARIPIRPHVTTYPLAEANRALADLKNDRVSGTAVLVME